MGIIVSTWMIGISHGFLVLSSLLSTANKTIDTSHHTTLETFEHFQLGTTLE